MRVSIALYDFIWLNGKKKETRGGITGGMSLLLVCTKNAVGGYFNVGSTIECSSTMLLLMSLKASPDDMKCQDKRNQ